MPPDYDALGRVSTKNLSRINKPINYTYLPGGFGENSTTTLVGSVTQGGVTTSYTYDNNGNITEIKENGVVKESYTYDSLNQLTSVTRNGVVTSYEYGANGNILSVTQSTGTGEAEQIKSYSYSDSEWKDLLTSFNGQQITYDTIGNPLTYRGKTMTWERGRKLSGITENGNTVAYAYDDSGIRLSKTVNGQKTTFYVVEGELLGQQNPDGTAIEYMFDETGTKCGFISGGETYYYNLNLQGDVVGIFDSTGADVVQYAYDEWGKLLSVTGTLADTVGQINPIRYRGYYYDSETGFYYLQSRYYDPETGRFINADKQTSGTGDSVQGYNLFAYCNNNPINMTDENGDWPNWLKTVAKVATIVAVAAVVVTAVAVSVATCGATSIAATIAISSAITLAARATEVAVLQVKKDRQSGKSVKQTTANVVDSLFDNGGKIIGITPVTKTAGYATGFYSQSSSFKDVVELQKLDGFSAKTMIDAAKYKVGNRFTDFSHCISAEASLGSMVISYGFAAYNVGNTLISIFADNPDERAATRGYSLR